MTASGQKKLNDKIHKKTQLLSDDIKLFTSKIFKIENGQRINTKLTKQNN